MSLVESKSSAISSIVWHFSVPSRVTFYENVCNLVASDLFRLPWLLFMSLVVLDSFHYKGHTCSRFYDVYRYEALDVLNTSTEEAIDWKIKSALSHMRCLAANMDKYLKMGFSLLNIITNHYELTVKQDVEGVELTIKLRRLYRCSCVECIFQHETLDNTNNDGRWFNEVSNMINMRW